MSQGKLEEKYKGECHIVSVSAYIQHVELCVRSIGELCEKDCVYFTSGLFKVIARNQDSIDLDQLTEFLEQAMQVEQIISCHFPHPINAKENGGGDWEQGYNFTVVENRCLSTRKHNWTNWMLQEHNYAKYMLTSQLQVCHSNTG